MFDIVNQLNRGAALIRARDEHEQLSELNLRAGERAKAPPHTPPRCTMWSPVRHSCRTMPGSDGTPSPLRSS